MANYKLVLKKSAAKEIEKLPQADRVRIIAKISDLSTNPRPDGCKKLSGQEKYRIRQGDYRILYQIQDHQLVITVVKVGHRKDVYGG
jgi:mRNA interferase RelE/StbE